jgi:hypothetical protein
MQPTLEHTGSKNPPPSECYGIRAADIARICGVDVATARRWKRGTRRMPESARKILACDLGCFAQSWRGWAIRGGKLVSPEGWQLEPGDVLSIPLMRAQISAYQAKERSANALDEQPLPAEIPAIKIARDNR